MTLDKLLRASPRGCAFFRAFPPIVRKRIDTTLQLIKETLDEFRPNYAIATAIMETLEKMGFKEFGVEGERLEGHVGRNDGDARQDNKDDTDNEAYFGV